MNTRAAFAFAAALAVSWLATAATAAAESAASGSASQLVQVYVAAGSSETIARTRVAVQELVARLELPTVVRDAAGAGEALLHRERSTAMVNAYIDLRALDAPRVVVADGASGEVLESRTLPPATSMETAVEAVAHVLYVTVESVLRAREDASGRRADPAPVPTPVPQVAPSPEPGESPREAEPEATAREEDPAADAAPADRSVARRPGDSVWGVGASVAATAASFGPSRLLAGARVGIDVAARGLSLRPGVVASFGMYAPGDVTGPSGAGSVQAMELRVVPYVEWAASSRIALYAGAGLGADFVRFDPERAPAGAVSVGTLRSSDPMITTLVGAKIGVTRALALVTGAGIDVDANPRRYVAAFGPRREIVFEMSSIRPHAFVGVDFSFAGAPLYAGGTR